MAPSARPLLPFTVPDPIGLGEPGAGYPCLWSVFTWIEGELPVPGHLDDVDALIDDLAALIHAFHRIELPDPPMGYRGPVSRVDSEVRKSIELVSDECDARTLHEAWEISVTAPEWDRAWVWTHGDLLPSNLMLRDGRLIAVIDFGAAGIADPACDLMIAWNVLPSEAREGLRAALTVDEATWLRGRGWALAQAVIALPYYRDTNPGMTAAARHTLRQVLTDLDK